MGLWDATTEMALGNLVWTLEVWNAKDQRKNSWIARIESIFNLKNMVIIFTKIYLAYIMSKTCW